MPPATREKIQLKPLAFQILNFRSIEDSGWTKFSPDSITVLVGQNESGKSSVLEALHYAFSRATPTQDDFRIGAPRPVVNLRIHVSNEDAAEMDGSEPGAAALKKYLSEVKNEVTLRISWEGSKPDGTQIAKRSLADGRYAQILEQERHGRTQHTPALSAELTQSAPSPSPSPSQPETPSSTPPPSEESPAAGRLPYDGPSADELSEMIWEGTPLSVLFNEDTGRLPSTVDIDAKGQPSGQGAIAATNFLQVAQIDLPKLLAGDTRMQENVLNKANSRISADFGAFWSQTIGRQGKLTLKCELANYGTSAGEKAGKPHLIFWISDGNTQLYPKQRSQGVRWFVSFYLQLKASEKARQNRLFLLDEPGANLHSKAQGDVLKLINELAKDTSSVLYTTHSPQLIEHAKLFRVHAVQRDGDLEDSPTVIVDAHRLGAASTDTLSPVLSAMGADLSQHQVIKKSNNVLLEEISGFYYLTAFWKLVQSKHEAHFIAATGVNKLETLANMFRGWGLEFVVAVDDDKQGREVFRNLKRDLYGDDDQIAGKSLIKLPCGTGIEDVFSPSDFQKFVLTDSSARIDGTPTEYLRSAGRSKPVIAFQFALAVDRGEVTLGQLSAPTQSGIRRTVQAIEGVLPKT